MHIHLSPRHLILTGAINNFVVEKISSLEHISEQIIAAHVVLIHDEAQDPSTEHRVKVHLAVPGKDIHAECADLDLYAAVDGVTHKLARQLRKRKTRLQDKKKSDLQKKVERKKRLG